MGLFSNLWKGIKRLLPGKGALIEGAAKAITRPFQGNLIKGAQKAVSNIVQSLIPKPAQEITKQQQNQQAPPQQPTTTEIQKPPQIVSPKIIRSLLPIQAVGYFKAKQKTASAPIRLRPTNSLLPNYRRKPSFYFLTRLLR